MVSAASCLPALNSQLFLFISHPAPQPLFTPFSRLGFSPRKASFEHQRHNNNIYTGAGLARGARERKRTTAASPGDSCVPQKRTLQFASSPASPPASQPFQIFPFSTPARIGSTHNARHSVRVSYLSLTGGRFPPSAACINRASLSFTSCTSTATLTNERRLRATSASSVFGVLSFSRVLLCAEAPTCHFCSDAASSASLENHADVVNSNLLP